MKIAIKEIVNYKGHSVKTNGNVDLSFSAMYDQITKSIEVLQLLNTDVKISAKLPGKKPVMLGSFNVKNVLFDNDGESVLKFNTMTDFVEMNNINSIITQDSFQLKLEADVEIENSNDEEEE